MGAFKKKLQSLLQAMTDDGTSDSEDAYHEKRPYVPDVRMQLTNLKNDIVSTPRKYFLFVFVSFLLLYALFGNYGVLQRLRLEFHHHKLINELAAEKQRTQQLKSEITHARELEEVERIAREKYNLTKKGETVYIIK